ncbi:thiamine-phosphate diphosphorylase [Candidatus Koribacter versatilis Ellin345]|uniref:Thiamine-phosphate diphosphorylase n=1 Tax=Koribacter versatilis (strain Ellin345) TaxID=204669 RepID=Q1II90_KORVE|nr:thiamine phosphate synthase [Candidatus Koribacter versatilis]ABF43410.1 thiamine-phosphate diphosphorylase [Candidatus Koribacter versatilis Ellin345]
MILYYITDRRALKGDLIAKISEAAHAGVDYVQLREKDLSPRELERLARGAMDAISGTNTKLLVNSRSDVAISVGAHGVHLTSNDISAGDARALWRERRPVIGVSCHSTADVRMAEAQGADFAVLAPVFGKGEQPGIGLQVLAEATGIVPPPEHTESAPRAVRFPALALGGVTVENARMCLAYGAAGVAGIRLFQENDVSAVVRALRAHTS